MSNQSWLWWRSCAVLLLAVGLVSLFPQRLSAAVVEGTVTDPLGAPIARATVALLQNGKIVASTISQSDGTYQLTTSAAGRFYVVVSSGGFKQIVTEGFYAGAANGRQANVVLEPSLVRQEIVTSATGIPAPQAQVSASTSLERNPNFRSRISLADTLRQIPGVFVVQQGQYGGATSILVRGGNSSANQVNLDGVPIDNIGGGFDFSNVATTGLEKVEVERGPDSVLYGADAVASVIDLSTPRGSTSFPSLFYDGDIGNFHSFRNQLELGGTHNRIDYYGGFSAFQSSNSIPMNEYHDDTGSANLGFSLTSATEVRVSARNSDSAMGTPGAYSFYGLPNSGKQSDQDTYLAASIDSQSSLIWHNLVRYGLVRKREEDTAFYAAGIPIPVTFGGYTSTNYYGYATNIRGANGDSVVGQAVLNFPGTYPRTSELVSNLDDLYFQSDYAFTGHITGLFGFRFTDERGADKPVAYAVRQTHERANYDYSAEVHGDYRARVYYTLAGGVEKNQLFGTVGTPRLGLAYYPVRPGSGILHGTKIEFNYSNGYREPSLEDQFGSLQTFLLGQPGGEAAIQQFHVPRIGPEDLRAFDGGGEQSFFSQRGIIRVTYFHNQFRNQIEFVPPTEVPALLPNLAPGQRMALEGSLMNGPQIDLNSQSFRAQGVEAEVEFTVLHDLFLRGGYTYDDAVVQRSFTSSALSPSFNTGPPGGPAPAFASLPIGAFGPLRGARPFRRPPHTGFVGANYTGSVWSAQLAAAFASRSDDSTFLGGSDFWGGNSLLLPNRNLDYGYAKIDLGGSYQMLSSLAIYAQVNNLTSNQHIGPIGYPSLPLAFRLGVRLALGRGTQ